MHDVRDAIERAAAAIGWRGRVIAQTALPGADGLLLVNGKWLIQGIDPPDIYGNRFRVSNDGRSLGRNTTPAAVARVVLLDVVAERLDEALAPAGAAKGGDT